MPLNTLDSSATGGSSFVNKDAVTSTSSAAVPGRRFEYVHVLLLTERFRPISSLPVNSRVIAQTETPLDLTLPSDDDTALFALDFSQPEAADSTAASSPHAALSLAARRALQSALSSLLATVRLHYGPQSSFDLSSPQSDGPAHTVWPVRLQTLKAVMNPVNANGDSDYAVVHQLVKRPLPNAGKIHEALTKIHHAQASTNSSVRLDYLNMTESTVPDVLYRDHGEMKSVNLSHNHFLYFPSEFCGVFKNLRELNLSHNSTLFHLPAEISKLQQLQTLDLRDCQSLLSLPLTLPRLTHLSSLLLYGCTNLSFPPYEVAVRCQLATAVTEDGKGRENPCGIQGLLRYIEQPTSWLTFNLNELKKSTQQATKVHGAEKVHIRIPSFRQAYSHQYIEYEIQCQSGRQQWTVWRRYSQFLVFAEGVERCVGKCLVELPGKTWSLHEEDAELCEQRRQAMSRLCEALRQWEEQGTARLMQQSFARTFFELETNSQ